MKKSRKTPDVYPAETHSDSQADAPPSVPTGQARTQAEPPNATADAPCNFEPACEHSEALTDRPKHPAPKSPRDDAEKAPANASKEKPKAKAAKPRLHRCTATPAVDRIFRKHDAALREIGIRLEFNYQANACLLKHFDQHLSEIYPNRPEGKDDKPRD